MKLITQRDMIKEVYQRWIKQYPTDSIHVSDNHKKIGILLSDLDLEKTNAKVIEKIIGNDSWTHITCSECGNYVENCIMLGDSEFLLCIDCARKISNII